MSKKTKTTSQSNSTTTSTPTNPTWVTQGLEGVGGGLQKLMGANPLDFIAGPSSLQTKAWGDAGNLKLSDDYGTARGIFNNVAGAGANTYDSTGYDPTDATSQGYDSVDWTGQGYDATKATSQGYNSVDWTGEGYDATTGNATNYDFIKAGQAQGYDPTNAVASTYNASSLLDDLGKYRSPYANDVVNTALADYDYGAGQTRANQALDEARSGAFGGSGAAITRALTEDNLTRGRGTLSAGLRDQEFTRATGLAATDAGFRNDAARYNADANTRVSMSNADAANAAAAFGANARNTFSLADADAANRAAAANADAANRFGLANMDARNAASAFGANARNTSAAANAAARNDASRFTADAANRVNISNADAANAAAAFGANARNTSSAANASARNAALAFGADAANRTNLANAAARNDASRFGADARNTAAQYNAGAKDTALNRQLSAGNALASLGSTMGADSRANIALQNALGGDQRAVEQALKGAPLDVLERIAKMYGGLPLNLLTGNTTTGNSSSSGTSKTWDPAGTLSSLLSAGGSAAQGASALMALSDRRLKTDVEKVGERPDGLGVYAFRYLWSPVRYIGVMAQEVLGVKPEAVVHLPGGYMAVNYGAL